MDNNDILKRIRYTFDLDDAQMIEIFAAAEHNVNRAKVSDWLKKEDDSSFQVMADRDLAIFLNGFINERRGKKEGPQPEPEQKLNNNIVLRKLKIALNLKNEDIQAFFELVDKRISPHELSAFFRNPKQSQYRACNDQFLRNFLSGMQQHYRPGESG